MMKSQKNIIVFAAFHIMVLLSPLLAKGLHHHVNSSNHFVFHHEKSVSQENQPCFICDFEYVNVINSENIKLPSVFTSVLVQASFLNQVPFCQFVHYYSLRAPPAC